MREAVTFDAWYDGLTELTSDDALARIGDLPDAYGVEFPMITPQWRFVK
jgi:hypothetical protein